MTLILADLALATLAVYATVVASIRWYNGTRWRRCIIEWNYGLSRPVRLTLEGEVKSLPNGDYRFRFIRPFAEPVRAIGDWGMGRYEDGDWLDSVLQGITHVKKRWPSHRHVLNLHFDPAEHARLIEMVEAS